MVAREAQPPAPPVAAAPSAATQDQSPPAAAPPRLSYRWHTAITIAFTVLCPFAFAVGAVVLILALMDRNVLWPVPVLFPVAVLAGFYLPVLVMCRVPARCPKCGGRADLGLREWRFRNSFIPTPVFNWRCATCPWCTVSWPASRSRRR